MLFYEFADSIHDYIENAKTYWINAIYDKANELKYYETQVANDILNIDTCISYVNAKLETLESGYFAYTKILAQSYNNVFKKLVDNFSTYIQQFEYRPYLNEDFPMPPYNPTYRKFTDFFSYYKELSPPDISQLFKIYWDLMNKYPRDPTLQAQYTIVLHITKTSTYDNFYNTIVKAPDNDNIRMNEFIEWWTNQNYGHDVSIWLKFKQNKIPNIYLKDKEPLDQALRDKYELDRVMTDIPFSLPGYDRNN